MGGLDRDSGLIFYLKFNRVQEFLFGLPKIKNLRGLVTVPFVNLFLIPVFWRMYRAVLGGVAAYCFAKCPQSASNPVENRPCFLAPISRTVGMRLPDVMIAGPTTPPYLLWPSPHLPSTPALLSGHP